MVNSHRKLPHALLWLLLLMTACTTSAGNDRKELPKAKNVILFIGDGMGLSQVTAAYNENGNTLRITEAPYTGLITTHSWPATEGSGITDSAAGATALATGTTTYDGAIGLDPDRNPVKSILHHAIENGLSGGLIATSSVTHATPASFIAHQPDREMHEEIAADFLKTDIDLFIGGGLRYFNNRSDGRNLLDELSEKGYRLSGDLEQIRKLPEGKVAGLLADKDLPRYSAGRGEMLSVATEIAIERLSSNPKGFFLMVEGSQIDWGGHSNDAKWIIEETLDFDRAVGAAIDFARKEGNTLVVVTADHETGGVSINRYDHFTGEVGIEFTTTDHTGTMVPVFAFGPGAERFTGVYHNTGIFDRMMETFGFYSAKRVN